MPDIVLSTFNAKYVHSSFGLRYLRANLGTLREASCILEFDIHEQPLDAAASILSLKPRVVGFGVYIWNLALVSATCSILKAADPNLFIIAGGPEVSYPPYPPDLLRVCDLILTGEAELIFPEIAAQLLRGLRPKEKLIHASLPELDHVQLPYAEYSEHDLATRLVYVEASRGCPFKCAFCLSSLDQKVRHFPLDKTRQQLRDLLERGAKKLVFVDRTFNLPEQWPVSILDFLLEHQNRDFQVHFEFTAHLLPDELKQRLLSFEPGRVRLEVGVQTLNEEVNRRIHRYQPKQKTIENLHFLCRESGAHVHVDLIVGLPGETLDSIAESFDTLVKLEPNEIQVGILKRLKGAPINEMIPQYGLKFSPVPPYEILETSTIDFETIQLMRAFARYWQIYYNSGRFKRSLPLLWAGLNSPFWSFFAFTKWLINKCGRRYAISLESQAEYLARYLAEERRLPAESWIDLLIQDYCNGAKRHVPVFLRKLIRAKAQ